MAPDRGLVSNSLSSAKEPNNRYDVSSQSESESGYDEQTPILEGQRQSETQEPHPDHDDQDSHFTFRAVFVGLAIGVIICFSNTYFGLQTGWISGMAMPAALISFAYFKLIARYIDYPFTPVENVLVTTVAGAVGTMPLGCGFVGVMPALNFLLSSEENGPLVLSTGKLIIWAVGVCFFGVVFAVPLRKEVIIRERLKFPSGTATALVIGVLHGNQDGKGKSGENGCLETFKQRNQGIRRSSSASAILHRGSRRSTRSFIARDGSQLDQEEPEIDHRNDWKAKIRTLLTAFTFSAAYTLIQYFIPHLRNLPVFGLNLATNWLWTLNPSPAYVGQGIIMGPATTFHMLLGAIVGWGILSPLAKSKGWAAGPVSDWATGSKGWIVWISLAIMLADSVVNLGWLVLRPSIQHAPAYFHQLREYAQQSSFSNALRQHGALKDDHSANASLEPSTPLISHPRSTSGSDSDLNPFAKDENQPEADAPASQLISNRTIAILFVLSILVCILSIRVVFGTLVPFHAIILAILLALLLSLMSVRALGETDLNPVSGISKLTQLCFAFVIPASNPNAVIINLLAGAISESGALQAGDMMQDLKAGHLLGAAPSAQFYGQIIGSFVGAIVGAAVYQLYTRVYEIPGGMFQVPTAYVWIFTARLVTGQGLPEMAWEWALGAGVLFTIVTAIRVAGHGQPWQAWLPGGIAVAVGMYNVPSFTLARAVGGGINWYWRRYRSRRRRGQGQRGSQVGDVDVDVDVDDDDDDDDDTPAIVLASGLILGEGMVSILNLALASLNVPHW